LTPSSGRAKKSTVSKNKPPVPEVDLRARVLAASVALITEEGLAALSMREVARRAGVSHQAPYHHFPDRESILAAIAGDGFLQLAEGLELALGKKGTPSERLRLGGRAYVEFARRHPAHFRVMFRPELVDLEAYPEGKAAADRAYRALEQLVAGVVEVGGWPEAHAQGLVLVAWSFVHGLSSLVLDGPIAKTLGDAELEAAVEGAFEGFRRLVDGPGAKKVRRPTGR
jgi:AcrR family transcriptional regulator